MKYTCRSRRAPRGALVEGLLEPPAAPRRAAQVCLRAPSLALFLSVSLSVTIFSICRQLRRAGRARLATMAGRVPVSDRDARPKSHWAKWRDLGVGEALSLARSRSRSLSLSLFLALGLFLSLCICLFLSPPRLSPPLSVPLGCAGHGEPPAPVGVDDRCEEVHRVAEAEVLLRVEVHSAPT